MAIVTKHGAPRICVVLAMTINADTALTALRICGARESMVGVIVGNRQLAPLTFASTAK